VWLPGIEGGGGYIRGISISQLGWWRDPGWEEAVHMPSCVTYVTQEHFVFVKRALAYLAASIVRGRSGRGSCGKRRETGYHWLD